jgi:hypothetical protein
MVVYGRTAGNASLNSKLGIVLQCSDGAASLSYDSTYGTGIATSNGTDLFAKYSFVIIGTIQVTVANSTLNLTAYDETTYSSSNPLTFGGRALIQVVGSIN